MIVFGLILVVLALAAGVVLFLASQSLTTPVNLELAGYSWGMTPLALLITGAVVMLLFGLGLGIIRGSAKRRRRPVHEAKEAERQARLEESIRADERARAEETHQSALAERDRVRDEEFQTRLADRDRERDSELASRQEEFTAREQASELRARENEERVRVDERRKVEQELDARTGVVGAGAAGSGLSGVEAASGRHAADTETDGVAGYGADDQGDLKDRQDRHDHGDPATTDATQTLDRDHDDDSGEESSRSGLRTVADKIMGREHS